ncbi:MAG: tRNA preQ1(34) S-adenosylmethionine ribosyltransferase-isomerase QueA, partial [Clostridiales bacterium]|nr:tRNA preQ1(34) S-adenosylmethionine ribosyltransferase-isomerase QueA [Clostridiales bacterium]
MKTKDFYFDLPKELIAQTPLKNRSKSRMLVIDRKKDEISHKNFDSIVDYFNDGDCLVLNNTKVLPARIFGKKATGATVEFLLLERLDTEDTWRCLVKPGKKARPGAEFTFGDNLFKGKVISLDEGGTRQVQFDYQGVFEELLDKVGQMPLPPYIKEELKEQNRYQTVYAKHLGSAAAPTAGLHFTDELLTNIRKKGVKIAFVTLHVGLGTFRPVKA